jgi:hypothetical protein
VNIHPGSYRLMRINLDRRYMRPLAGKQTKESEGEKWLLQSIGELHDYAQKKGVRLFVETLPRREPDHWRNIEKGRLKTQKSRNVPVSALLKLAEKGYFICNDFMHTAADEISSDRNYLFGKLFTKTKKLALQTKLIHINTMQPPFNGTDCHIGILDKDFKKDVFPTRRQLIKLLSLFKDRDDVWVIPEPFSQHIENTKALIKMIKQIH